MTDRADDHYRTLQVDPAAEPEVIEAAYRALARKHHPDRNPSPSAPAEMARLNQAFEVLRSPATRAVYDADLARNRPRAIITPPPAYQPEPRRSALQPSDGGRGVSLLVLFPLFLLAGAGLVLLILFGPLGESELEPSAADKERSAAITPTRRLNGGDRTGTPVTPTPTSAPSTEALRNSLLRSQKETAVEEQAADVTGDGVAELLVLVQPASCSAHCKRALLVVARGEYWRITDLDEQSVVNVSLEPPGIEIFQALKLTGEDACCPTTGRATFHRWTGKAFAFNGVYFEALGANDLTPEEAVRRFYESITRNGLIRSYAMFSRPYQDRHPYESWSADFATTDSVRVNKVELTDAGVVAVDVTATNADAGSAPERYTGTWWLVESRFGWRLDQGDIELAP